MAQTSKKILDHVYPMVKKIAEANGGTVAPAEDEIDLRFRVGGRMRTVQVWVSGKTEQYMMISGIDISGIEKKRCRIAIPEPVDKLQEVDVEKAIIDAIN